ncbi:YfbM family protein [Kribbella sp. NPDC003505]|uniref:YfbM family protein n=1 Tax=Kribbella sp. NPDC003505 TaxID=3154448 RepID=UPI0033AF362E
MSLGMHFAITDDDREQLLEMDGADEAISEYVHEIIEERADDYNVATDKAWDAIHRSLTDGRLAIDNGSSPLNLAVLGGKLLTSGEDELVVLVDKDQVPAVAAALMSVTQESLRRGYEQIDAADYAEFGDEDFDYTWDNFRDLTDFWQQAAASKRHVIFTA